MIRSLHGHDGFLIEMNQVGRYIEDFLAKVGRRLGLAPVEIGPLTLPLIIQIPELTKFGAAAAKFNPPNGAAALVDERPGSKGGKL